jgi:hypothetical protein
VRRNPKIHERNPNIAALRMNSRPLWKRYDSGRRFVLTPTATRNVAASTRVTATAITKPCKARRLFVIWRIVSPGRKNVPKVSFSIDPSTALL